VHSIHLPQNRHKWRVTNSLYSCTTLASERGLRAMGYFWTVDYMSDCLVVNCLVDYDKAGYKVNVIKPTL
jgi:hypothetical protein